MSTRTDEIALRSLLLLVAALALVMVLRFCDFNFLKRALAKWESHAESQFAQSPAVPTPRPETKRRPTLPTPRQVEIQPVVAEREIIAVTPIPVPRITRLRVEPDQWSAPLRVPLGHGVGIKFSLGRIRVEKDGEVGGILYRNPTLVREQNALTLRPLAALNRSPRLVWFDKRIRVLRFKSLEKKSEDVEVLWER